MAARRLWDGIKDDTNELLGTFCCCLLEMDLFFLCMPTLYVATQGVSLLLQMIGTFVNHWIYTADCNYMGLNSKCLIPQNTSSNSTAENARVFKLDTGEDVYILQIVSFSMALICLLLALLAFFRLRKQDSESKSANHISCFSCVLPLISLISGFLNFVGCMMVAGEGYSLGYGFYLCLSSGLVLMIISCLSITGYCCMKCDCFE